MSAGEAIAMVLLAHLCGDYLLQTHWMATQKVTRWWPAIVHGVWLMIVADNTSHLLIGVAAVVWL